MIRFFTMKLSKTILFFFSTFFVWAQNNNARWEDHFSYAKINTILEINGFIFCGAENGIFSYDPNTGEIQKFSKANDLNDIEITTFNYSEELELLMVGYKSGEMDFLGPEENYNLLEIPLHQFYYGDKRVNHILPHENIAVISGEFGLATFDLENLEFMETVYFTHSNVYFGVKQSAILNNVIYAASDKGIYKHELDGFIPNFTSWQKVEELPAAAFQKIVEFNGKLIASSGFNVYVFDGFTWSYFDNIHGLKDIRVNENVLSITQNLSVRNYNENLSLTATVNFPELLNTGIKVGSITYGGSNAYGLSNGNTQILPDGPYNNRSWGVSSFEGQLWISPGGLANFNSPLTIADGFYHFNGEHWIHYASEQMLDAKDILDVAVNPNNPNEFYAFSWFEHTSWDSSQTHTRIGMFKFVNGQMVAHYNSENSGLVFRERLAGGAFDEFGNLWISQTAAEPSSRTLAHRLSPTGNWETINLGAAIVNSGARKPVVYNGHAFIALPRNDTGVSSGLKITDMQEVYTIDASNERGALPSAEVISAAIDKNGVLWIGTLVGLRVLYNPLEAVKSGFFETQPVIIVQNGIPEALLMDVQINSIEVDSGNQKWIGTESSGVYCVSEDGTQTIYHFTSSNSPLPSNKVNDISVDPSTGVVYFATDRGVISFRSDVVEVGDSFGDVYAYPNPVRPGFSGEVTIKGLPNNADVRIVDVVGNLIYETKAKGGVAKWDTTNLKGRPVASGVYLVLMTNEDASQNKQTKIAIVR